jgi:hypothetical protein
MSSSDLSRRTWGINEQATPEEQRRATRYVASVADSPADCRRLLDALGLLPARMTATHGLPGYRAGCRCDRCVAANRRRLQRQRATTTADCPINTTTNYGGTE